METAGCRAAVGSTACAVGPQHPGLRLHPGNTSPDASQRACPRAHPEAQSPAFQKKGGTSQLSASHKAQKWRLSRWACWTTCATRDRRSGSGLKAKSRPSIRWRRSTPAPSRPAAVSRWLPVDGERANERTRSAPPPVCRGGVWAEERQGEPQVSEQGNCRKWVPLLFQQPSRSLLLLVVALYRPPKERGAGFHDP